MFAISTKGLYGARAVLELASRHSDGIIQIRELSEQCDISKNYLEQLFGRLKKAGIIKSVRGAKGGFSLARDPRFISLLEVLEVLEGKTELNQGICKEMTLNDIFGQTENCIKEKLAVSFFDLAEQKKKNAEAENVTFYI